MWDMSSWRKSQGDHSRVKRMDKEGGSEGVRARRKVIMIVVINKILW